LRVPEKKTLLFHLANDPLETNDLSAQESARTAIMRRNLLKQIKTYQDAGRDFKAGKVELDDKIKDELRALGYVQ